MQNWDIMSAAAFDLDLSALEHAHMCMYEACLHAQLPLTEALRLLVQHVFQPLPPVTPADEVRNRLEGKMRAHFSEVRFTNDIMSMCRWSCKQNLL